ncbi:MAG: tyrosine-type recombinase/integrase, partial [Alphaproteobacteria bacterium]
MYIKIRGEDPIRRSLHTDQFDEAKEKAWREFDETRRRIQRGIPIKKIAFKDLSADYLLSKKNDPALAYHRETIKRHFKPYFGTHLADFSTLSDNDILSYLQWRRKKYDDEGIPLTNQTINRENVVLRLIVKHAVRRGYIPKSHAPTIESQKEIQNPGREFTSVEFVQLRKLALSRIEGLKKADLLESRRLIFEFLSFMVNTGLRPGEGKQLRWQDVNFDDRYINVAGGKTGSRQVVGRGYEMKVLANLRKRREAFAEKHQ